MFETAGALSIVEPLASLVWLVAVPALWAAVAVLGAVMRGRAGSAARRSAIDAVVAPACVAFAAALAVIAIVHAARLAALRPRRILTQHLGVLVRVGQLDASFELGLDARSAILSVTVALVALAAALHASTQKDGPPRLAATGLLTFGAMLAVLADSWLIGLAGIGATTLALATSVPRRAAASAFAGDALIALGFTVLFWALGGTFSGAGYASDLEPRLALVSVPNAPAPPDKASLSVTTFGGALVTSDGGPSLSGEPLRAPFTVLVDPDVYSFRVHTGPSAADRVVTHVSLAAGRAYVLTPYGPTTSTRNLHDQIAVARPRASGPDAVAAVLSERTAGGVSVVDLVAALVVLGALLRLGLICGGSAGLAAPIAAVPGVDVATRLAPLMQTLAPLAICAAFAALLLAARGCTRQSAGAAAGHALAAAIAMALSAMALGDVAAGFVIALPAVLAAAAAVASLESGGHPGWFAAAAAAMVGLLPGGAANPGFAAMLARSLGDFAESGEQVVSAFAALVLFVASCAVFRAHRQPRPAEPKTPLTARALAPALVTLSVVIGAVLGTATTSVGGSVTVLGRRLLASPAPSVSPREGVALLAAVATVAAAGLLATASKRERWLAWLGGPGRLLDRAGDGAASVVGLLARGATAMDRDVIEDVPRAVGAVLARAASALPLPHRRSPTSARRRVGPGDAVLALAVSGALVVVLFSLLLGG
jgi:hypothetical protein